MLNAKQLKSFAPFLKKYKITIQKVKNGKMITMEKITLDSNFGQNSMVSKGKKVKKLGVK